MQLRKKSGGFSLLELLVVVGIVAVGVGAAFIRYKRDKSKDNLMKAAWQYTSILRGASAAGMAVGRNVCVKMDPTATNDIVAWVDDNYDRVQGAAESVIAAYKKPTSYTDVQVQYIKPGPTTPPAILEFLHRGDARYNDDGFGSAGPYPSSYDGVFLRLCTVPTPATTDKTGRWYSYVLHARTSFVEVFNEYK